MKTLILLLFVIIVLKSQAQEITMFPNIIDYQYYRDNERISKKELTQLLENNQNAIKHWNKSKVFSTLAWASIAAEIGLIFWYPEDSNSKLLLYGTTFGPIISALTFSLLNNSQKKKAVLKYNQGLDKKTSFRIEPASQGIGVAVVF